MAGRKQHGFTIIEVSLFLAISGLMAAILMTGWTAKINQERYRDSVRSLHSFVQQQYNLVYNVENGRSGELDCASAVDPGVSGVNIPRGQDDCVLLGRYIAVTSDKSKGTQLEVSLIIGSEPSSAVDDLATPEHIFNNIYDVRTVGADVLPLSDASIDIAWMPWLTQEYHSGVYGPVKEMTLAILRSPATGAAYTYAAKTHVGKVSKLIKHANRNSDTAVCINSDAPFAGEFTQLVIRADASSQSAVETVAGC